MNCVVARKRISGKLRRKLYWKLASESPRTVLPLLEFRKLTVVHVYNNVDRHRNWLEFKKYYTNHRSSTKELYVVYFFLKPELTGLKCFIVE